MVNKSRSLHYYPLKFFSFNGVVFVVVTLFKVYDVYQHGFIMSKNMALVRKLTHFHMPNETI